ncbi:unnamed protein product, partial [marine sediment metagenome]
MNDNLNELELLLDPWWDTVTEWVDSAIDTVVDTVSSAYEAAKD